jgi:hypothetical protein
MWTRLWSGVIEDVPANLEECESCRELDCTQERWETCEKRIVTETASLGLTGNVARTGELLPRVPLTVRAPAMASDDPPCEAESQPRQRRITSH